MLLSKNELGMPNLTFTQNSNFGKFNVIALFVMKNLRLKLLYKKFMIKLIILNQI